MACAAALVSATCLLDITPPVSHDVFNSRRAKRGSRGCRYLVVQLSKCPNCNAPLRADRREQVFFCEYCGTRLFDDRLREEQPAPPRPRENEAARKPAAFCRKCGGGMPEGAAFCAACGTPAGEAQRPIVVNVTQAQSGGPYAAYPYRSRWAAFFLCLLFGIFGAHRFYVGKAASGILWLLTFGLFGIGMMADLILILFGAFRDGKGWPLR